MTYMKGTDGDSVKQRLVGRQVVGVADTVVGGP